jgi:hypothetical protein
MADTIKDIIEDIEAQIDGMVRLKTDLDSTSFQYEEGVLISVNDAKKLIKFIKKAPTTREGAK